MSDELAEVDVTSVTQTPVSLSDLHQLIGQFNNHATEVKSYICSKFGRTTYDGIKSSDICKKGETKVTRLFLFDTCDKFLSLSQSLSKYFCNSDNSKGLEKLLSSNVTKLISDAERQCDISKMIASATDAAIKAHSEAIAKQLCNLKQNLFTMKNIGNDENQYDNLKVGTTTNHNINYLDSTLTDLLSEESSQELEIFLSKQKLSNRFLFLGQCNNKDPHNESSAIPPNIKTIIDKLNHYVKEQGFNYELNSCVISRDNCLEYSDDNYAINPESSIFSLNIGAPSAVLFRDKITGEEHRHLPKPNIFLVMSRSSQIVFSHRHHIKKSCNGPLYTLTFKCMNDKYLNSTCLIGDSNTRAIKFGSGRGTVGERYPGKQVYAPIIEQIDALVCASYQNVVLTLGINDIKSDDIRSRHDVEQVYNRFKTKIHDITTLYI